MVMPWTNADMLATSEWDPPNPPRADRPVFVREVVPLPDSESVVHAALGSSDYSDLGALGEEEVGDSAMDPQATDEDDDFTVGDASAEHLQGARAAQSSQRRVGLMCTHTGPNADVAHRSILGMSRCLPRASP